MKTIYLQQQSGVQVSTARQTQVLVSWFGLTTANLSTEKYSAPRLGWDTQMILFSSSTRKLIGFMICDQPMKQSYLMRGKCRVSVRAAEWLVNESTWWDGLDLDITTDVKAVITVQTCPRNTILVNDSSLYQYSIGWGLWVNSYWPGPK